MDVKWVKEDDVWPPSLIARNMGIILGLLMVFATSSRQARIA
jgi:hypothetical protein